MKATQNLIQFRDFVDGLCSRRASGSNKTSQKWQLKAKCHLICSSCDSWVDLAKTGVQIRGKRVIFILSVGGARR